MFRLSFCRAAWQPATVSRFQTASRTIFRGTFQRTTLQTRFSPKANLHTVVARPGEQYSNRSSWRWSFPVIGLGVAATLSVASGASAFARQPVLCDSRPTTPVGPPVDVPPPPLPQSSLNVYELSFGTVCGICAGVFIKKGLKIAAFVLGGIFVLLQYFNSLSLISINWDQASNKFDNLFSSTGPDGVKHPPTLTSLWNWLVNFLLADFQQRASFLAGLLLGLRVG